MGRWIGLGTALALAAMAGTAARAATAVPVQACSLQTMSGPQAVQAPAQMNATVDAALAGQIAFYSAGGNDGVFAPAGWHCFAHSGSDGVVVTVVPGGDDPGTGAVRGSAVRSRMAQGYAGHASYVLETGAPLFSDLRSIARKNNVTTPSPFAGEQVAHAGEDEATFFDPPEVAGSGAGSGGDDASWGYAKEFWNGSAAQQHTQPLVPDLLVISVTLPPDQRALSAELIKLNRSK